MPDMAFSPTAQQWVNVVLIWVGFGTLAGLLATIILPLRRSVGPFTTLVIGIVGSAVGLFCLNMLYPDKILNPISPIGFLAAAVGAFFTLIVYRAITFVISKIEPKKDRPPGFSAHR